MDHADAILSIFRVFVKCELYISPRCWRILTFCSLETFNGKRNIRAVYMYVPVMWVFATIIYSNTYDDDSSRLSPEMLIDVYIGYIE